MNPGELKTPYAIIYTTNAVYKHALYATQATIGKVCHPFSTYGPGGGQKLYAMAVGVNVHYKRGLQTSVIFTE